MWPIKHNYRNASVLLAVAVALIMAWAAESLQGQMQARQGSGRDANRLVGSGGRNPANSGYTSLGNQIISGNVGGGKSFKGSGGIGSFRSFQGSLGSSSLGSFRRDSYGLVGNAASLGVPQPFYLPSSTVLGVRDITSGRNQPGSNIPRNINLRPPPRTGPAISRGLTGVPSNFASLSPADLRADLRASPQGQAGGPSPIVETASNLFGIRRLSPELGVGTESERRLDVTRDIGPAAVPGRSRTEADVNRSFQALPPWARPGTSSGGDSKTDQEQYLAPSAAQQQTDKNLEEARALIDQSTGGPDMPSIVDVYERMMAEDNSKEQIDPNAIQTPDETISPLVPSAKKDREAAIRDLTAKMLTYNSFVGNQASSFNDLMAQAESLLKNRQYYYAARTYKRASELRPENPLAYLGRTYSLTGAGDLISASNDLAKALELFPDQAKRKIDLQGFFHSPEELTRITTKLEAMADALTDNVRIRLLLGYIYRYSGQNEAAIRVLNEAAASAKSDEKTPAELTKTIEKFAQAVAKQAEANTSR